MNQDPYRIILADDHEIFRLGLKTVIQQNPELQVVGEAKSGLELIHLLETQPCEMVILDLSMPEMDGFEILDQMAESHSQTKRVVLSMHVDRRSIKRAMSKQIDGFINKEDIANVVIIAIQTIRQGKKFFSQDIQEIILTKYDEIFGLNKSLDDLTKREREIAQLIATGLANKDISAKLNISIHTVQFHRSNIMSKMGLKNTADLVRYVLSFD